MHTPDDADERDGRCPAARPPGRAGAGRAWALAALLACAPAGAVVDAPQEMWVELSVQPPAPGESGRAAQAQRERVERQQAQVIARLRAMGIEPTGRLHLARSAIAVRVPPSRRAGIEGLDGVLRVRPSEPLRPRETQDGVGTLKGAPR